jgi:hypothetical protein
MEHTHRDQDPPSGEQAHSGEHTHCQQAIMAVLAFTGAFALWKGLPSHFAACLVNQQRCCPRKMCWFARATLASYTLHG